MGWIDGANFFQNRHREVLLTVCGKLAFLVTKP